MFKNLGKIILYAFSACAFVSAQTDRDQAEILGPAKSVEVYIRNFFMTDGKIVRGDRRPWFSMTYHQSGGLAQHISYSHDTPGAIVQKSIYTY